ncbi:MAG: P27 family phage terminase small subunit [Reyranellaceae bacterium]
MGGDRLGAPPAHLDAIAAEEWRRLADRLADQDVDPTHLEVRCQALSRHRRATQAMGDQLTFQHGSLLKPRPELAIIADAEKVIASFDQKYDRAARRDG